ncbi:MAG: XRE family transcriptional regulator, partial [Solirubrobacteraceae bacterium]
NDKLREPAEADGSSAQMQRLFSPVDQAAFSNDLGQQIRTARQSQQLTLETISQRSGISIGALSQVERGKGNPAFFTLLKIAHALEVPLTTLLQLETRGSPVVRARKRRPLAPHFFESQDVKSELLTPDLDRQLQVCRYVLPPGATTEDTPFVHRGEEFITVVKGQCVVGLEDVEYELGPGDSIAYPATTPHWFAARGPRKAELLFACTPPTF